MTRFEYRIRNYIRNHKKHVALTSTLAAVVVVQHRGIKNLNKFLDEHDLLEEYYFIEEDSE